MVDEAYCKGITARFIPACYHAPVGDNAYYRYQGRITRGPLAYGLGKAEDSPGDFGVLSLPGRDIHS